MIVLRFDFLDQILDFLVLLVSLLLASLEFLSVTLFHTFNHLLLCLLLPLEQIRWKLAMEVGFLVDVKLRFGPSIADAGVVLAWLEWIVHDFDFFLLNVSLAVVYNGFGSVF